MSLADITVDEEDCLYIEAFELEDISILDKNLHHEYPKYEIEELPELKIGDNL